MPKIKRRLPVNSAAEDLIYDLVDEMLERYGLEDEPKPQPTMLLADLLRRVEALERAVVGRP